MLDKIVFAEKFGALCDRFGKNFSKPTLKMFYEALEERLTTEEFISASKKLFTGKFFPDLQEFFDLAEADRAVRTPYVPPHLTLEAAKPVKAYVDMSSEEQAAYRAQIARVRAKFSTDGKSSSSGLTPIAGILGQVAEKRQWLSDPVLRMEAIEWAMAQEGVDLVMDDEGFITGLNLVEQPVEAIVQ